MEWLNQKRKFSRADCGLLEFLPGQLHSCTIDTLRLWKDQDGRSHYKKEQHKSEEEFSNWVKTICPSLDESYEPGIFIVLYPRLYVDYPTGKAMGTMSLPCEAKTFLDTTEKMFQHRSLSQLIKRSSTAVFSSRFMTSEERPPWGTSIVYNCISDTASPTDKDDVAMSVTCFPEASLTFASMYGCNETVRGWVTLALIQMKGSGQAFHPLLLPMLFAELERKRLFNLLDRKKTELHQRTMELENRIRRDMQTGDEEKDANKAVAVKDCESTNLWIEVSSLKNGLESLKTQLEAMIEHSKLLCQGMFERQVDGTDDHAQDRETGKIVEARLRDMVAEFKSKIRTYDTLLGGMAMAAQMEWNYYTRRDTRANISIANATKRDSSQMKSISLLGMVFLPGTFLATLFSMGFFNWNSSEPHRMVSPWIVVYAVATVILTTVTIWRWKKWTQEEEKNASQQLLKELDSDKEFIV